MKQFLKVFKPLGFRRPWNGWTHHRIDGATRGKLVQKGEVMEFVSRIPSGHPTQATKSKRSCQHLRFKSLNTMRKTWGSREAC